MICVSGLVIALIGEGVDVTADKSVLVVWPLEMSRVFVFFSSVFLVLSSVLGFSSLFLSLDPVKIKYFRCFSHGWDNTDNKNIPAFARWGWGEKLYKRREKEGGRRQTADLFDNCQVLILIAKRVFSCMVHTVSYESFVAEPHL